MGAVAFWHAVEATGGPRRTPKESVGALEEALMIRRTLVGRAIGLVRRQHYQVMGAHHGPQPAHPVRIWLRAYGPRMLRLMGRECCGSRAGWPTAGWQVSAATT